MKPSLSCASLVYGKDSKAIAVTLYRSAAYGNVAHAQNTSHVTLAFTVNISKRCKHSLLNAILTIRAGLGRAVAVGDLKFRGLHIFTEN